jgi:hypothetical protein
MRKYLEITWTTVQRGWVRIWPDRFFKIIETTHHDEQLADRIRAETEAAMARSVKQGLTDGLKRRQKFTQTFDILGRGPRR